MIDGHYLLQVKNAALEKFIWSRGRETARVDVRGRSAQELKYIHFVFDVDFMVKLLRACVWMPWRKKAMKDVVSCDKLREAANRQ